MLTSARLVVGEADPALLVPRPVLEDPQWE